MFIYTTFVLKKRSSQGVCIYLSCSLWLWSSTGRPGLPSWPSKGQVWDYGVSSKHRPGRKCLSKYFEVWQSSGFGYAYLVIFRFQLCAPCIHIVLIVQAEHRTSTTKLYSKKGFGSHCFYLHPFGKFDVQICNFHSYKTFETLNPQNILTTKHTDMFTLHANVGQMCRCNP